MSEYLVLIVVRKGYKWIPSFFFSQKTRVNSGRSRRNQGKGTLDSGGFWDSSKANFINIINSFGVVEPQDHCFKQKDARFEFSILDYTIHDLWCVKVIWGHWPFLFMVKFRVFWNVLAHSDNYLVVLVDLKASIRRPSSVPVLHVWQVYAYPQLAGWPMQVYFCYHHYGYNFVMCVGMHGSNANTQVWNMEWLYYQIWSN